MIIINTSIDGHVFPPKSWFKVDLSYQYDNKTLFEKLIIHKNLSKFCKKHFSVDNESTWSVNNRNVWKFKYEQDAAIFKLTHS